MRMIEFQKKLDLSGMKYVPIILCAFVFGCNSPTKTPVQENATTSTPNNTWRNPQLTAVLNAQDHRDSKALLAFLNDSSAVVRKLLRWPSPVCRTAPRVADCFQAH
jgi:hypothetical protein